MTITSLLQSNYNQANAQKGKVGTLNGNIGTQGDADQSKAKNSGGDFQTFIQLLLAQMKNQDPTQPVDATQYVSQLASFSAVEQAVETNKTLDNAMDALNALLVSNFTTQAGSYIGKYVASEDGKITGTVKSVKIYEDGLLATLDNGKELVIKPGVTVRDKAPDAGSATPPADNKTPPANDKPAANDKTAPKAAA